MHIIQAFAILFCVVPALASAGSLHFLNYGYLPETKISFGRYIGREYGAFYLSFVEEVEAGDVINAYSLRVEHGREVCYPDSERAAQFPVTAVNNSYFRDLSGAFKAEVAVDIGADVRIVETDAATFVRAVSQTFTGNNNYAPECSWLESPARILVDNDLLVVRTLLYLDGVFKHSVNVSVDGQLSVDITDKLKSFLSDQFRDLLSDIDLSGSVDGKYSHEDHSDLTLAGLTPVAIYPEYVSEAIVEEYLQIFREQKMEEWLSQSEGSVESARNFLKELPSLLYEPEQLPRLFVGEDLVAFDPENEAHVFALKIENRIVLLNYEARLVE